MQIPYPSALCYVFSAQTALQATPLPADRAVNPVPAVSIPPAHLTPCFTEWHSLGLCICLGTPPTLQGRLKYLSCLYLLNRDLVFLVHIHERCQTKKFYSALASSIEELITFSYLGSILGLRGAE